MRKNFNELLNAEYIDTLDSLANIACIYRDHGGDCETQKLELEVMNGK